MIAKLEKVGKHYENQGIRRDVLKDINFEINKGDTIAIVGPSGSGKSTLLNILGTLDNANKGLVQIGTDDITKFDDNQLAEFRNKEIGFIFQLHHLLPQLNLIENVLVPVIPQKDKKMKAEAKLRAMELLKEVGLEERIHQRPGQMSGGECQRAAVVRALINEPKLILADEPTGSLDQESAEQVGNLLAKINEEHGVTLVVVTHSMELAKKMKKVYKLVNGSLVSS